MKKGSVANEIAGTEMGLIDACPEFLPLSIFDDRLSLSHCNTKCPA